ncbi:MAG: hypothetical protein ACXVZX_07800 [Terriglobales bacterium]
MARGWESKSVEEQQSQLTRPTVSKSNRSPEDLQRASRVQALQLQRAHVREQMNNSQNARFTELMRRELEHLEKELRNLDGSSGH